MKHLAAITLWAICLTIFAIGIAANLPWLIAENARLKPWKIPIIWLSEITGLIIFLEYGLRQIIDSNAVHRGRSLTVKAFILATIFDCSLSVYSVVEENAAHSRAVQAQATVVSGRARLQNTGHTRYTFTCVFHDQQGVRHTGWFSNVDNGIPTKLRSAIAQKSLPADVEIAYDPRWPARSWLADVPYTHDNRLFIYSLLTALFSVALTAALAHFTKWAPWLPTPRVAPFLGATCIFYMGAIFQGGW